MSLPYSLSLIAAVGPHNELGLNNGLLWHIKEDLQYFKQVTSGHTVLMGLNTFLSLPKRPLPGRHNIVLSFQSLPPEPPYNQVTVCTSLEQALQAPQPGSQVFVMGGASVYAQLIDKAQTLYITHVDAPLPEGEADVWFPPIDPSLWEEVSREAHPRGATFDYPFAFCVYKRKIR